MPDPIAPAATTALAERTPVPVRMGLAPTSIEEGWRLAQYFAKSGLVPKDFRDKPENVLVAIQMGIEIGLAPMQALQSIAVINGRPGVWGDGFLALLQASPQYQDHDEYFEVGGERRDGLVLEDLKKDDTAAVCTFWRRGKATPVTRRFTIGQAKKAGLLTKEGPWQQYPDRMLAMRARSFAGRDTFADRLRGIKTVEELRDSIEVEDVPAPVVRQVTRLSQTPAAVAPPGAAAASTFVAAHPGAADVVITGRVIAVQEMLGRIFVEVVLLSGTKAESIEVPSVADATELEKFVGTDHTVAVTCLRPIDEGLHLVSFAIAD